MNDIQWFDNIRIYHILLDRFNGGWKEPLPSTNDFCGGNLHGVIEKLSYIKKLGFSAIMLSPIFCSASYHGYHILSYDDIDPHFGSWQDFEELIQRAHNIELKIICDFVPNHCHYRNHVFQMALLSNGGKHRDWFFFPKKNSDEYVSFMNLPDLPKFNLENQGAADYMVSKARRLANMGVDGFRIDHALGLPFSFLKYLRYSLKSIRKDIVVFGEVWAEGIGKDLHDQLYFKSKSRMEEFRTILNDILCIRNLHSDSDECISQEQIQLDYTEVLDGVLDFAYRGYLIEEIKKGHRLKGNLSLRHKLVNHFKQYPCNFKLILFLDNHDTDRFMFECDKDATLLKEAIELTNEQPRPFSVFYGTEQLMTTDSSIFNAGPYADLRVRQCMDWTHTPINILNINEDVSLLNRQNKMPIVNGNEWSLDTKTNDEQTKEYTNHRKIADNEKVEWMSVTSKWDISSLILQEDTQNQLKEIAAYIEKKDEYIEKWGIKRFLRNESCTGINFYGVSGTGKSIAAEAIADACGRKVIKASYSQIQSDRWGGTENNLTSLFEKAQKTNSIIILNEADGLFSKRQSSGANSETNNQIKCHILNLMDSYDVVLVLTTNRFEDYDEAFYRRTMFQVEFPLPDKNELTQLWKMHLGCLEEARFSKDGVIPKPTNFSFENIANISDGLSGGDIRRITLGAIGKILGHRSSYLLTEEVLKCLIDDYKKKRINKQEPIREAVGKEKEDILNVLNKEN